MAVLVVVATVAPTWQVLRSDFDKLLMDTAVSRGADLVHGEVIRPIVSADGVVRGLTVRDDCLPWEMSRVRRFAAVELDIAQGSLR